MKCRAGIASNLVPPPLPCACHIWQASFHCHMLPSCLSKPVAQLQCHVFDWIRPILAQPSTSARGTGAELGICQLPNIWAAKPGWTLIEWRSWRPQREIHEELFWFNVPLFEKCSLVDFPVHILEVAARDSQPLQTDWPHDPCKPDHVQVFYADFVTPENLKQRRKELKENPHRRSKAPGDGKFLCVCGLMLAHSAIQ